MNTIHEWRGAGSGDELAKLIDTIPYLHHQVLRQKLASLYRVIQRIAQNHVVPIAVMDRLERRFLYVADQLEANLEEQECWLFAWLRRLVKQASAFGQPRYLGESLVEALNQATAANQETLQDISQLQMTLCHPEWTDKGLLVEELIDYLRELEEELTEYDHLEREELSPRVQEICQSWAKEEEVSHAG
jgi:iron-sulfur cluster repair protein YtfE (RIC family)